MKTHITISATCILLCAGCVTTHYPDQREAFLASHPDQGYELSETSVVEMQMALEQEHFVVYNRLGKVKKRIEDNDDLVDYINLLVKCSDDKLQLYLKALHELSGNLTDRDRVFRYSQDREDGIEEGLIVIRDGRIVQREITAQQVISVKKK